MAISRRVQLRFDPQACDRKWQARWEVDQLHRVDDNDPRPPWYALTMYPYPSGDLHIGHWYAMAPSDAHARFMRMHGYNVLHPMGFDAFGLPAENAAIQRRIHPYRWTMENIEHMRKQLRSMGTIYDWEREVVTCDPNYYRWNQWLFLQLYRKGLAYRALAPVNWCPACRTVLANEQVIDGKCERSGDLVIRREMEQWFFRITKYADELLDFSGVVDWPERIKAMQSNWIGRSEGVEISFEVPDQQTPNLDIRTFTTRIDTIFGVTFLVLAPEHPLVDRITTVAQKQAIDQYVIEARKATEVERLAIDREKSGVFTGAYAINRLNGDRIPIFIADYVLLTYGTGAVMGVPAHDQRDFEFALKYDLEIRTVVAPIGWDPEHVPVKAYSPMDGHMVNSNQFDGLPIKEGYQAIVKHIEKKGWGKSTVSYRMRDWLISRQRYWGTPIPILYCTNCGTIEAPENELPILLPEDAEFRPTGESPLRLHQEFCQAVCPECGGKAQRETDTMDTFVDSSWYFLRFASPNCNDSPFDPKLAHQWCPVNQYTGGAEHAVMHLLYARFFTKVMRDLSIVEFDEPFLRLFNQGTILSSHAKMSKSRGNVIAPDDYVNNFGADIVRLYLMFIGPWEGGGDWSDTGINGVARWMNRVWELCERETSKLPNSGASSDNRLKRLLHQTIRRVANDIERFKFNTALAALMEFTNTLTPAFDQRLVSQGLWQEAVKNLLLLMAPMAPHVTEELWERIGEKYSIHCQPFPSWDNDLAAVEEATLIVQVNGKLRDRISIPVGMAEEEVKNLALTSARVRPYIDGKQLVQLVYVQARCLINAVVRD